MSSANFPEGHVFKDTYRVGRLLGAGGMGVVYEVTHLRTGRRLALKVLNPESALDGELVARFRREAEVAGQIGHPNIVGVVDFDQTPDGTHILVMELVEGQSLQRLLVREGHLPLQRAAGIVEQVAAGLQAAHEHGVVHRDLKPENIMLCREGEREVVKVLDFGLCKLFGATPALTRTDVTFGTPLYMSPEQALEASAVNARSDVFSLGAVTYHMLAGQPPFLGSSAQSIVSKVLDQEPESLSELRPDLPVAVVEVVSHALQKKPEERCPSAAAFAAAFRAAMEALEEAGSALSVAETLVRRPPGAADPEGDREKTAVDVSQPPALALATTIQQAVPTPTSDEPSAPFPSPRARWGLLASGMGIVAVGAWMVLRSGPVPPRVGLEPKMPEPRGAPSLVTASAAGMPEPVSDSLPRDAAIAVEAREPPAPPPTLTSPSPRPRPTVSRRAARPRRPEPRVAAAASATLSVTAGDEQGSLAPRLRLDGRPYVCCPGEVPGLTVGQTYILEAESPGYHRKRLRIRIANAGLNRVHLKLQPSTGSKSP